MTFPNSTVNNKNEEYNLQIHVCTNEDKSSVLLDIQRVLRVEIFNKLNEFYTTGSVTYLDQQQHLDNYIGKPIVLLQMVFRRMVIDPITKASVAFAKGSFSHDFIVSSIHILQSEGSKVTYRLDFVDVNWWKMNRNISYSTYGDGKKQIGCIIENLFSQVELNFKCETKEEMSMETDYISRSSENLMEAFEYLTKMEFYNADMEKSLTMLAYNMMADEYFFYNMKTQKTSEIYSVEAQYPQANTIILSMYDADALNEMFFGNRPGLGLVSHSSKTDVLLDLQQKKVHSYDIGWNGFDMDTGGNEKVTKILTDNMMKIYNESLVTVKKDKYKRDEMKILQDKDIFSEKKIEEDCSLWDNNINLYRDTVDKMINNDSLVLSINGNINRFPGNDFMIYVNNPSGGRGVNKNDNEESLKKYENITGVWIVSSVRHIIEPSNRKFVDVIGLFRNW